MSRAAGPQVGLARGTLLVVAAEALAFPAGLVATILLTRHLPAAEYGALALGLAAVAWLEWTVVSLFSRAAYKMVAEPVAWRAAAAAVVRSYVAAGLIVGALVFVAAGPAAALLGVPALRGVLQILAAEVPLFTAAQAYRAILVGRGRHTSRAAVAAARWTARALLVAIGVVLDAPLVGLAWVFVAATTVELALVRWRIGAGVSLRSRGGLPMRRLLGLAAPLAISAVCIRLFERLDIFAIRLLGAPLETVAAYGVAQNLALAPGLLATALVPALIAALSYRFASGDGAGAHRTATLALRVALLMLPLACLAAGAARLLVVTFFGADYAAAAPLFTALVLGAVGSLLIGIGSGILVAADRPNWTIAVAAPMLPVAAVAHLLVIPRVGAVGAAAVTAAVAGAGAAATGAIVRRMVGVPLPLGTLARALLVGAGAYWAGSALRIEPGLTGLVAVCVLGVALIGALMLAGELSALERENVRRWLGMLARRAWSTTA